MIYRDQRCGEGKEFGIIGAGYAAATTGEGPGQSRMAGWRKRQRRMSFWTRQASHRTRAIRSRLRARCIQERGRGQALEAEKQWDHPERTFCLENCER